MFLVPVDRAQQRVDVQKHPLVGAGQQRRVRGASAISCASHRGELVGMSEASSRSKIPTVEGAYTSSNTRRATDKQMRPSLDRGPLLTAR